MSSLWTIACRELYAYFRSAIAYIVAAAFLFLCGLFFVGGVARWQDATLQAMFGSLSIVLIFVAPVLTMRLLSREQDLGTIELLLTAPVRDWQVIVSKWLGTFAFYVAMLLPTLVYWGVLAYLGREIGKPDTGPILAAYLGALFLGGLYIAIGIFASSLTENSSSSPSTQWIRVS